MPLPTALQGNLRLPMIGAPMYIVSNPDNLPEGNKAAMDFGKADKTDAKAWRDIWGAGQGVGNIDDILPARELILRMEQEYEAMQQELRKPE